MSHSCPHRVVAGPSLPTALVLSGDFPPTLACGTHLKNTVCALNGNRAEVSAVHANLGDEKGYDDFSRESKEMLGRVDARVVAHDMHPDYMSTTLARRIAGNVPGVVLTGVQHHHAHIASCMAEHGLEGPVIGLALDGTGYGSDGTMWGGEVLVADYHCFRRVCSIAPLPLPGGDRVALEPWRMGLSYLYHAYGPDIHNLDIRLTTGRKRRQLEAIIHMMDQGINVPLTSSCGRMFDAVAAVLGICSRVQCEGEAAMKLESLLKREWCPDGSFYPFGVNRNNGISFMDPSPMIRELVCDNVTGVDAAECSHRFHNGLIHVYADSVIAVAEQMNIQTVVFGGGCFLNKYLREGLRARLVSLGFGVFLPQQLPVGDAGVSLGQAVIAASIHAHRAESRRTLEQEETCSPS